MPFMSCHFDEDVLGLFCHVLTFSFFSFNSHFYKQTGGVWLWISHYPLSFPDASWSTSNKWVCWG